MFNDEVLPLKASSDFLLSAVFMNNLLHVYPLSKGKKAMCIFLNISTSARVMELVYIQVGE